VWDQRAINKPLAMVDIDTSAGVLIPYFDPDNSILYCAGKGDGNIRYFEIVDTEPYVHFLSEYRDNQSQKGIAFLPKKAVDVSKCEIAVCLRLLRDRVVPVSFQVPRKSDMFQKDLYPDSYAGIPSLSADEWLGGVNKAPKKVSMKPGDNKSVSGGGASAPTATLKPQKTASQLEAELEAAHKKIAELEAQVAKLKK
jgi:coronin-1B/1C/6